VQIGSTNGRVGIRRTGESKGAIEPSDQVETVQMEISNTRIDIKLATDATVDGIDCHSDPYGGSNSLDNVMPLSHRHRMDLIRLQRRNDKEMERNYTLESGE